MTPCFPACARPPTQLSGVGAGENERSAISGGGEGGAATRYAYCRLLRRGHPWLAVWLVRPLLPVPCCPLPAAKYPLPRAAVPNRAVPRDRDPS